MSALSSDAEMLARWVVSTYLYYLELEIEKLCRKSGKDCRDVLKFLEHERLKVLEIATSDIKKFLMR